MRPRALYSVVALAVLAVAGPSEAAPRRSSYRPPYLDTAVAQDKSCAPSSVCNTNATATRNGRMSVQASVSEQTPTSQDDAAGAVASVFAGYTRIPEGRRQVSFTFHFSNVTAQAAASTPNGTAASGVALLAAAGHSGCRDCDARAAVGTRSVSFAAESMGAPVGTARRSSGRSESLTVTVRRSNRGPMPAGIVFAVAQLAVGAEIHEGRLCVAGTCEAVPLPHVGEASAVGSATLARVDVVES